MQKLKYYVLWTKNSKLLEKYFTKYYKKLIWDLKIIKVEFWLKQIENLLNIENRDFILNADISSLIQSIILDNNLESLEKLKNEINLFLDEWIDSENLIKNKWDKIEWTNIRLTDFDNNPYSNFEAHPDHIQQKAISWNWGEKDKKYWLSIYKKSFDLLKNLDEWIYDELNQIITKIIPLWTARWMHNSASYKECIGHLYMGLTLDSVAPEVNNLEAIIHESSHNKLNLILQFDPIVLNDVEYKYYSAIRPDARHLQWVFLGYHAFAPTMYIIMKAYASGVLKNDKIWLDKIVLYYIKTKFLQKVIRKYARLTKIWEEISLEIDYVISLMDNLFKKINPPKETILNAKRQQTIHFTEVNKNYLGLKY